MPYAWIENDTVRDLCAGNPSELFHPDVAQFYSVEVPGGTERGATLVKGVWTNPVPVAPAPALGGPVVYSLLSPMQFYLAFTPSERIAIKKSTDPVVEEFWATYQLAAQVNAHIDPNLASVAEGLAYLATATTATPPGAGILAGAARIAQIQAGIAQ